MRILLIEDDECIAQTLENVLRNEHYAVDVAVDGQLGWDLVETFSYDLILLDVLLPKLNGIQFCQRLRSCNYQMPVLLLTAQDSGADKVLGLNAGADDYVVKPFDFPELLARIRVLLRRGNAPLFPVLHWENLQLDSGLCRATYQNQVLNLTPKEYRLLELFLRNQHQVFSRSAILEHLWSSEEVPNEDTVTAHIKGLRHKLKQAGAPTNTIETVYGLGYRLKFPDAESTSELTSKSSTHQPSAQKDSIHQKTKAGLDQVWEKFKGQNGDRLSILEQASQALRTGKIDGELRQKAHQTAHKLAGSLGIFGLTEGSRLAREVEQILHPERNLDAGQMRHVIKQIAALRLELEIAFNKRLNKIGTKLSPNQSLPLLLVIENDLKLAKQIVARAAEQGLQVELAPDLAAAKAAIDIAISIENTHDKSGDQTHSTTHLLDGVLLNLSFFDLDEDSLDQLATLINQTPPLPVLFCTTHDGVVERVKATRLGTHAFFQKPLVPSQVLETIARVRSQVCISNFKVMVVDDDPQLLAVIQNLMSPWGVQLATVEEPLQFWNTLETFSPDLLLLDVEMPRFSGIELCQIVRNAPRWSGLPILFLSVHTDTKIEHQAFEAGANAYFSKSIVGPELVTQVLNRLERSQLLRSMSHDG
jgi:DNA-binding response OmpR family regulator/HPt (histidine-containing phosphotransfer) domain-containing protein